MLAFPITPPLPACIVYNCREGREVIGNAQSASIFVFVFSAVIPMSLFAVCILSPQQANAACGSSPESMLLYQRLRVSCALGSYM